MKHEWETNARNILKGYWCKKCATRQSEELCRMLFEKILNKKFINMRPDFLKFEGKNLELDGYNEELNLAFEYNGRQHYEMVGFYKTQEDFNRRLLLDKTKIELCQKNKTKLIIIPYTVTHNELLNFIKIELDKLNVEYNKNVIIDLTEFTNSHSHCQNQLNILKEIVKSKNGVLLTNHYIDVYTRIDIRCDKGHEWETNYRSIVNSNRWCPKCGIQVCIQKRKVLFEDDNLKKKLLEKIKNTVQKNRKNKNYIESVNDYLKKYKLICISSKEDYMDEKSILKFKCDKNHIMEMVYKNIRNRCLRERPCIECEKENIRTSKDVINDRLQKYGLQIEGNYKTTREPANFVCNNGHIDTISFKVIRERIRRFEKGKSLGICVTCNNEKN